MKEIEIMLTDFEIRPREIRVPAQEPVRFLVINFSSLEHRFALESDQCCLEIEDLKPGQTRALEHVFAKPGSFKTACHFSQEDKHDMRGWLVVEA